MKTLLVVLVLPALLASGGCSRHVVINPDRVSRYNDIAWTVVSVPGSAAPAEPVPPPRIPLPPSSPSGTPTAPPATPAAPPR